MTAMKLSDLNDFTKKQIRTLDDGVLANAIKKARGLYYEKGRSPISDEVFDRLEDELERRDPNHPLLTHVGSVSGTEKRKVKLPYPLYSLTKIKANNPKSFESWTGHFKGPYVVSNKEDGQSLEIIYDSAGKPKAVYTRGNGTVGQNVSHLIPYLKIPKKVNVPNLAVRAEATMDAATFKRVGQDAENPRNFVAGLTNRVHGDHSPIKHATIVAYEIINPRMKPSQALKKLKALGFVVPKYRIVSADDLTLDMLGKLFTKRRKASKRDIDGLVIENDTVNIRPPAGSKSPDYAFAFKMGEADDSAVVKVKSVTWKTSQYGRLIPVVNIPPTRLAGVTVSNVTGHNAFFIEHGYRAKEKQGSRKIRPIGPGAVIRIVRSGDVIPHIVEVVKGAAKPSFPKVEWEYDSTRVNIKLTAKDDLTRDKRITAFFSTLGVDGIKLGTVQQLTSAGLTSIVKILRADVDDLLQIPGFKQRKAEKLVESIAEKTFAVELPTLMDGSGYFGQGFGTRRSAVIVEAYPNLLKDWANLTPTQITEKVSALNGFQTKTASQFGKNFHKFLKWLKLSKIRPILPKKIKATGSKLANQSVCFTGFRDKDLEAKIVKQGGKIATGVNKNTTTLLYAPGKTSSKLSSARNLGIKTYTRDEFVKKYQL